MRRALLMMVLFGGVVSAQVPKEPEAVPDRFTVKHKPKNYPQGTPKEVLNSAIEATAAGRADYLVAHLLDPAFVEARIAERARFLEPGIEGELVELRNNQRLRPGSVTASERLPDDPRAFRAIALKVAQDRAIRQVMADVQARIVDDPDALKLLRRFLREGTFADSDPTAKATLPDVKDHAVFFKKIGDRWFLENRHTEAPAPMPSTMP